MVKIQNPLGSLIIIAGFLLLTCQQSTDPGTTMRALSGTVFQLQTDAPVNPAYIIHGDSLLAVTDETGHYNIPSIETGTYNITCSALGFRDTTLQIMIDKEDVVRNFYLTPDQSSGRVYGEFQDQVLWNDALEANPEIGSWSNRDLFEGTTGATLQVKWLQVELPDRMLFLGDSLLAYSDPFGQFWTKIQSGTYPLTGICEGYQSITRIFRVFPDEKSYIIFIMDRLEE